MYSEPCQTSKMELFAKIVKRHLATIFAKSSVLDVWHGSEYASVLPSEDRIIRVIIGMYFPTFTP